MRKQELEKMDGMQLVDLLLKYGLKMGGKRDEVIKRILDHEGAMPKRPPRNAAKTRLKEVRIAKGMTQLELAANAGINLRTLQHYEQGSKPFDSANIGVILRVCVALGCKLEEILENEDYLAIVEEYNKL